MTVTNWGGIWRKDRDRHETLGVINGEPYLSTVVKTYSCTGEYECPNGAHEVKQHIHTEYMQNKIRKADLKNNPCTIV